MSRSRDLLATRTSAPAQGQSPARGRPAIERALSLVTVVLLLAQTQTAEGQFNARGRGRKPPPSTTAPVTPPSSKLPRPTAQPSTSSADAEAKRDAELVARYETLVLDQPGEEVPLVRLGELIRKRDGHLSRLLDELRKKAETATPAQRYGALLALAFYMGEAGALDDAMARADQAVVLDPMRRVGYQVKAELQLKKGDVAQAVSSFEQALARAQEPERSWLLRKLRDLSLQLNQIEAARSYHQKLTQASQGNAYVRGELGRELLARGLAREAVTELTRVLDAQKGDVRARGPALLDLGEAEIQAGLFEQAIVHLTQAQRLLEKSPGKQVVASRKLAEAHQRQGTLGEYLRTLSSNAHDAPTLELLGQLYEQEGNTEQALVAYRRAARLAPADVDLKLHLARLLELSGDVESAIVVQREATRAQPRDLQLSLKLMDLLLARGDRAALLVEWDRSFQVAQGDAEAGLLLADLAERLQETSRHDRVLSSLLGQTITDPRILIDLGSRYYRTGDVETARKIWNKILLVVSDKARAESMLAEVLINHEAFEEGVQLLQSAYDRDAHSPQIAKALALGLERVAATAQGRKQDQWQDQAIAQYERVLKLSGNGPEKDLARKHLVRLWKRRGDLPARIEALRQQQKQDKLSPDHSRLLATALDKLGSFEAAAAQLHNHVKLYPGDASALQELAQLQLRLGQFDPAMVTYQKLIAADPKRSHDYFAAMSTAARKHGDLKLALSYAQRAIDLNGNDPQGLSLLGDLYLDQGQRTQAQETFSRALLLDDGLDDVRLKLADLLTQNGQLDGAFEHLTHLLRTSADEMVLKRAQNQLLPLGMALGQSALVEDTLRRLAIFHPESTVYRQLFFDCLSTRLYPLELALRHGTQEDKQRAQRELQDLAARSGVLLLSALSSGNDNEQDIALRLLSHDVSPTTQLALLAYAEGNHPLARRATALSSIFPPIAKAAEDRILKFFDPSTDSRDITLARAAIFSLQDSPRAAGRLLSCLDDDTAEIAGYCALNLSFHKHLSAQHRAELKRVLLRWADRTGTTRLQRRVALLGLAAQREQQGIASAQDNKLLAVARSAADDTDDEIARLGLLLMKDLPHSDADLAVAARALLSPSKTRQDAARAMLTPSSDAVELVDVQEQRRLGGDQLDLSLYLDALSQAWLDQSQTSPRIPLPPELTAQLLSVAQGILQTSALNSPQVFRQLDAGGVLESLRSELSDLLLEVARSDLPWADQALRHLRAEDGPAAARYLLEALADAKTRADALLAVSQGASVQSAEVLEAFERTAPPAFGLSAKLKGTWEKLAQSDDPDLRKRARQALNP